MPAEAIREIAAIVGLVFAIVVFADADPGGIPGPGEHHGHGDEGVPVAVGEAGLDYFYDHEQVYIGTEKLEKDFSNTFTGAAVETVEFSDLDDRNAEVRYDFRATIPRRAQESQGGLVLPISLYPHELAQAYDIIDAALDLADKGVRT